MFDAIDRDELEDAADMVVLEQEIGDEGKDEARDVDNADLEGEYDVVLDIDAVDLNDVLPGPFELVRLENEVAESPEEMVDPDEVVGLPDELGSTPLEFSDVDGCIEEVLDVLDDDEELLDCTWFAM